MKPQPQTQFELPVKTDTGWELPPAERMSNCFAACVASILDLSISDIPNFAAARGDWYAAFQDWLVARGMFAIEVDCNPDRPYLWPLPTGPLCIVSGKSSRGDHQHSVVARVVAVDGVIRDHSFEYVHDPHPSGECIQGPMLSILFIVKHPVPV